MIELLIIDGPGRGEKVVGRGDACVVRQPRSDHAASDERPGAWVLRGVAGGQRVQVNGEPADGRTPLRVGDRVTAGGRVYEVCRVTPPEREPTADDPAGFVLRFDASATPLRQAGPATAAGNSLDLSNDPAPATRPIPLTPRAAAASRSDTDRLVGGVVLPQFALPVVAAAVLLAALTVSVMLISASTDHRLTTWADTVGPDAVGRDGAMPSEIAVPPRGARLSGMPKPGTDAAAATATAAARLYVIDASGGLRDRWAHAADHLRRSVERLDADAVFLVTIFDGEGLSFVPARTLGEQTNDRRDETVAFLDAHARRLDAPAGSGDPLAALGFVLAQARAGDELVWVTHAAVERGLSRRTDASVGRMSDRLREMLAGCDVRLSVVELYDHEPHPALRQLAEDHGGKHTPLHVPRIAEASNARP